MLRDVNSDAHMWFILFGTVRRQLMDGHVHGEIRPSVSDEPHRFLFGKYTRACSASTSS
jgi:hypothetical protein